MTRIRMWSWAATLAVSVCLAGPMSEAVGQTQVRTWISLESALLAQASDLLVGNGGMLYVLDGLEAKVLVMSRPGVLHRSIGREGQGPGEFQQPSALQLTQAGDLEVVDRRNGRIQRLDTLGTYILSRKLPPYGGLYPSALSKGGDLAVNTLGDSLLMSVTDAEGALVAAFLRAPAAMLPIPAMSATQFDRFRPAGPA